MNLETDRLFIRPLGLENLNDFYAYRSDAEVARFQGYKPMSELDCKIYLTKNEKLDFGPPGQWKQFGLELKATRRVIGDIGILFRIDNLSTAELGISMNPAFQRQGFAKEAMSNVLDYLFCDHRVHKVVETVDSENKASMELLKAIGFREEAFFLDNYLSEGQWRSEYQFALLKREWPCTRDF